MRRRRTAFDRWEGPGVVSGWLGPCTNHGSRQPAADESRGALSHLEAGTRIVAADSIRNLGQEDRAAVMPHRHPRRTTSRNGDLGEAGGYQKGCRIELTQLSSDQWTFVPVMRFRSRCPRILGSGCFR